MILTSLELDFKVTVEQASLTSVEKESTCESTREINLQTVSRPKNQIYQIEHEYELKPLSSFTKDLNIESGRRGNLGRKDWLDDEEYEKEEVRRTTRLFRDFDGKPLAQHIRYACCGDAEYVYHELPFRNC